VPAPTNKFIIFVVQLNITFNEEPVVFEYPSYESSAKEEEAVMAAGPEAVPSLHTLLRSNTSNLLASSGQSRHDVFSHPTFAAS
jgi:hypothetical protein